MAQALTLPKHDISQGSIKGKHLFEVNEHVMLLDKELMVLEPGEKVTIAPGNIVRFFANSLSSHYSYHTRSKAMLTGPMVYTIQPQPVMNACQRCNAINDNRILNVGLLILLAITTIFAALAVHMKGENALSLLGIALLSVLGAIVAGKRAIRYQRVRLAVPNPKNVLEEMERFGFAPVPAAEKNLQ